MGPCGQFEATYSKVTPSVSRRELDEESPTPTELPGLNSNWLFIFGEVTRRCAGFSFVDPDELLSATATILGTIENQHW